MTTIDQRHTRRGLDLSTAQNDESQRAHGSRDPVTGLLSRRDFLETMRRIMSAGSPQSSDSVALLIIDIEHFRAINLSASHDTGDAVLREIGSRLSRALRRSDVVGRIGNDEFAALLPSVVSEDHALLAVNKILESCESPITVGDHTIAPRMSVGVSLGNSSETDADRMLREAISALTTTRRHGRRFAVHDRRGTEEIVDDFTFEAQLRNAIESGELRLRYQVKRDLRSGDVVGAEALARWPNAGSQFSDPHKFVVLAERTDMIHSLTYWSINEAVRQCANWRERGIDIGVAVNLSPRALDDPALPDMVARVLATWRVEPERLTLEITETAMMIETERGLDGVNRLVEQGLKLAIDDFGSGYSSLAYLCRLPVVELKIDKEFVRDLPSNRENQLIVRSIVELGHSFGLTVTAEGVETVETRDILSGFGCDTAQGFLNGPPIEGNALVNVMLEAEERIASR